MYTSNRHNKSIMLDSALMVSKCQDCGQEFLSSSEYKRHQQTHLQTHLDKWSNKEEPKINPAFRTNPEDYSKVEIAKINSNELSGSLFSEFRDYDSQNIPWESEQITKSHGIYLEFNRAKTGNEKDWMYMLRITIPG